MINDENKCACTFSIFAENSPGVLHRIIVLFTRRKMNIESLTVSHTETEGISRFTLVVNDTLRNAEKIAAQLRRIIEVSKVQVSQNEELIYKEIALFRIETPDARTRQYIAHHVVRLGASIVSIDPEALVIEKTGNEEEIETLFKSFKNVKIKEFIRSGRIAIKKHMSELNDAAETFKVMENQTRIDLQ